MTNKYEELKEAVMEAIEDGACVLITKKYDEYFAEVFAYNSRDAFREQNEVLYELDFTGMEVVGSLEGEAEYQISELDADIVKLFEN